MIYNEDTYCVLYHRTVREIGAVQAVVFNTIAGLIQAGDGCISNDTLCDLCGCTEQYIRKILAALIDAGYIDKVAGNGRGKKTAYILTEKGKQNAPLYAPKRGNKVHQKGETKCTPINKDINKDNKLINMEDFSKFFDMFKCDPEHENERERCERVWLYLPDDKKQAIFTDLEQPRPRRSNNTNSPYVYLYNFKTPLPYMRQGTAKFTNWLMEHKQKGDRICMVRYDDHVAWCLADDLPTMIEAGAELINGDYK